MRLSISVAAGAALCVAAAASGEFVPRQTFETNLLGAFIQDGSEYSRYISQKYGKSFGFLDQLPSHKDGRYVPWQRAVLANGAGTPNGIFSFEVFSSLSFQGTARTELTMIPGPGGALAMSVFAMGGLARRRRVDWPLNSRQPPQRFPATGSSSTSGLSAFSVVESASGTSRSRRSFERRVVSHWYDPPTASWRSAAARSAYRVLLDEALYRLVPRRHARHPERSEFRRCR